MTARVGYLTALASGRPAGPLLRPARRLFPPLALADAGYASPEPLAAFRPSALPPGPAAAAARQHEQADSVVVDDPAASQTAENAPGPAALETATGPRLTNPGAAEQPRADLGAAGHAGGTPPRVAIGRPAATEPNQPPTRTPPASSQMTDPGAAKPARSRARAAEQAGAAPPPAALGRPSAGGPDEPSVPGHPASVTAPPEAPSAAPAGHQSTPPTGHQSAASAGTAAQAGSPVRSASGPGAASGLAADTPGRSGPFGLSAVRSRREAAGAAVAAEPGAASPGYRGAEVEHDRSPAGQAGPADHARSADRAGPAGLERSADLPGPASRKEPAERAAVTVAQAERAASQPAPARPLAAPPDREVIGLPPRRREEAPSSGERATLSIGTVEITVLPPREQKSSAPPGPRRTAPAGPPERLSRGLGPWFGRDQG
ncbi:MAG: hypothetical protein ACRDOB_05865 [Streptosporangiaceae bacterium]